MTDCASASCGRATGSGAWTPSRERIAALAVAEVGGLRYQIDDEGIRIVS